MTTFRRRALLISTTSLVFITSGSVLCGFAIYAYRVFTNAPPPPSFPIVVEGSSDLPWRFHTVLSQPEKQHVLDGQFTILTSTRMMPFPVKQAFTVITRHLVFDLAEPGDDHKIPVPISEPVPFSRLIFAGVNGDKWFIHYEHGNISRNSTYVNEYNVVVLTLQPGGRVRFLWGCIGSHPAKDLDDLRKSIAGQSCDDAEYYW